LLYTALGNETDAVELEIGFQDGRKFRQAVTVSQRRGLAATRQALHFELTHLASLDHAFDKALGPAVSALRDALRLRPGAPTRLVFGAMPPAPLCSVIIPLFGRIDLLEVQLALFSDDAELAGCELIYVLDDPARRHEVADLARSVHARLALPFRLLMLDRNVGFAAASNVGLGEATAGFVCFLNSDVFPEQAGWLGRLIQRLRKDAKLGVVGPRLVYENGSIQHEGMVYEPQAEIGGWMFPLHVNKGRRPAASSGLRRVEAITGACMVMRRKLAAAMGGFDEAFVIGDFEVSDLCRRLAAGGFGCAVDTDVQLVHLERQSQGLEDAVFRRNLTAYNAWVHQRRWFA
jgi:GT2 family glycosyltransferase